MTPSPNSVWCFVVDITDEIGQIGVTQLLANRRVLTGVKPVVVDVAQQQRAERVVGWFAVARAIRKQRLGCHRVQPRVCRRGDRFPG